MSKVILLKDLKSKLNISDKIEVTKERYSWGIFRKISAGIDFSVIIYPENWQKIDNLKSGEALFYKDDQNARWNVKFDGRNLFFKDRDSNTCKVQVEKSELLIN